MTETQNIISKIEEQTKKTFMKTRDSIKNLLDKMRNKELGLDEHETGETEQLEDY